jgi:hypothetical protein
MCDASIQVKELQGKQAGANSQGSQACGVYCIFCTKATMPEKW